MRPVDAPGLAVRAMDVERMQAAFLAAEAVQQEQRARKGQEELARQQAEIQATEGRPGLANAEDAAPMADRERAAGRTPRRPRRRVGGGEASPAEKSRTATAPTGRLIDEYR